MSVGLFTFELAYQTLGRALCVARPVNTSAKRRDDADEILHEIVLVVLAEIDDLDAFTMRLREQRQVLATEPCETVFVFDHDHIPFGKLAQESQEIPSLIVHTRPALPHNSHYLVAVGSTVRAHALSLARKLLLILSG